MHCLALPLLLSLTATLHAQFADQLYRDAERNYGEMSYGAAADLYQSLADKYPGDPRVNECEFKVALSRFKLEQWEAATKLLEPYVQAHKESLWAAKARRILVLAYNHTGYDDQRGLKLLEEATGYLRSHADTPAARDELVLCLFDYASQLSRWVQDQDERKARLQKRIDTFSEIIKLNVSDDHTARATFLLPNSYAEPRDREKALALCRRVVETWPDTSTAPQAQLWIARYYEGQQDYVRALEESREVLRRWPKSDSAEQAQRMVDNIANPQVRLSVNATALPGKTVTYQLSTRNVKQVRLAAYRTDPEAEFTALGTQELAGARPGANPVREWTVTVPDPSGHKPYSKALEAPLSTPGVYHLVARDPASRADAEGNVNLTSLVLVQTQDPQGKLVTWTSRRTDGAAAEGVKLSYRYRYWDDKTQKQRYGTMGDSTTDARGLSTITVPDRANRQEVQTFGRRGDEVAWVNDAYVYFNEENKPEVVGYVYTDRPVYRPTQKVHFSAALRTFTGGEVSNLPNGTYPVTIRDARSEEVLKSQLTTGKYGTLHGDFVLGDEPSLGMYNIEVRVGDQECYGQFRVEEYKKPEFEVTVKPGGEDYKPGEKASATISAEYYFGGPVPGAKVAYTVQRSPYWSWYRFPRPYDWFYEGWGDEGGYPGRRGGGEVVTRGEATTDAQGQVKIDFDTVKDKDRDWQYEVKAEVTDQSRRTIEGAETIRVTRSSFFLHVNTVQGLYHAADKVTADLKAITPNDTPVQTKGQLTVYKLTPSEREVERNGKKYQEKYDKREAVLPEPLPFSTDAEGLAHVTFVPDRQGRFEIEVTAEDPKRDEPTKGLKRFWAVNDGFDGQNLDYTNLELVTERDVYEKGEKARILISAPVKDRDVLIWIAGRDLLSSHVMHLNGSAKVFELPIIDGYIPDLTIKAYVVGSEALFSAEKHLFVPPSEKFLKVTVTSDKDKYRPRETGHFAVTALTKDGKPADAEVCLAVTDESVYYIQSDLAGPIEKFFYARGRGQGVRSWSSWGYERAFRDGEGEQYGTGYGAYGGGGFRGDVVFYASETLGTVAADATTAPAAATPSRAPGMPGMSGRGGVMKAAMGQGLGGGGEMVEPTVRTQFADTCFWGPTLVTGPDGKATAEVEFPDNLTTWRATGRAITTDTKVGQTDTKVKTSKDIIARLQTPRFLVQRDRCTISTIAHNYLDLAKNVRVEFSAEGLKLDGAPSETVQVAKNGEVRVDRRVEALEPGRALVTTKALTDVESDAMQLPIPILPHGAEKFAWRAGQITGEGGETFDLPTERVRESDTLVVQITPSLAATLLEALPYLADYPYGCVEQTMNRFLPSVIVADTVKKLGLNAGGRLADLPSQVRAGLRRLYSQRNDEGGWGWWSGGGGDLYMTAYVLSGLLRAKAAGYDVEADVLSGAVGFLKERVKKEKRLDTAAYVAYVLAQAGEKPEATVNRVYESRDKLNEHSRALLALTLSYLKDDRAALVVRNLVDYRIETERGCHWGKNDWGWWWSDDNIEATSASLMALLRIDPQSPLISKTVWWLVTNRRNADHWKSTKDTALAISALCEYLLASHEQQSSYTASVYVNDQLVKAIEVTPQNALQLDARVKVDRGLLRDGKNAVRIKQDGQGSLYYALLATYYTLEEPIKGASSVISVKRDYSTVEKYVDDKQHLQARLTPLGGAVKSGTEIEVQLTITAENDFDYVMFEDYKPAGCEPVDLQSGYIWGEGLGAYREFRDEKVAFFIDHLPQGTHTLTYRVRAEIPGDFHALPNVGQGMYMPDVRCLSDEGRVTIE